MPASLFCSCIRCFKSSVTQAFSSPADFRTCRKALAWSTKTEKQATIKKRVAIVFV